MVLTFKGEDELRVEETQPLWSPIINVEDEQ